MKWGLILVTRTLVLLDFCFMSLADKEPHPGEHEEFIKPLWKQGVGSTIHCVAGDATGIILAAVIIGILGLPMWLDLIVEYLAGFAFGLFIFQSLFMKSMMGRDGSSHEFSDDESRHARDGAEAAGVLGRHVGRRDGGLRSRISRQCLDGCAKLKHGLMTVRDMIPLSASGDATRSNDAKMGDPHSAHKPEGHEEASKAAGVHHGAGHKMESQATWPQLLAIGVVRRLALKTTIGFDTGRYEANFTEDDLRIRIVLHH